MWDFAEHTEQFVDRYDINAKSRGRV